MNEIVYSDVSKRRVIWQIRFRRFKKFNFFFINLLIILPFTLIGRLICSLSSNIYNYLFPKRNIVKKNVKFAIVIYTMAVIGINIWFYIDSRYDINWLLLISVPIMIVIYLLTKGIFYLYYKFIGIYQILDKDYLYTIEYVTKFMPRIQKDHGKTGSGKDTFMAGCCSVLAADFKSRTIMDIAEIKSICFCTDFDLLDFDLANNYKDYLTSSKEFIEKAFLGDDETIGLAISRNLYIKKHYIKKGIVKPKVLLQDYYSFKLDPIMHQTDFCVGQGVNKKHFLDLIMFEYIQWWIRLNVEKNFLITNQPFIEDLNTGMKAKKFSLNMLRTKTQEYQYKKDGIKHNVKEKVFFPWKDRLILAETECGTWYMNRNDDIDAEMIKGGIRDFKAYHRHFMKDFYWFQADQAPERTNILFRELDHAYVGIMSRVEHPGGAKRNIIPNLKLKYVNFRIWIYEKKYNRKINKFERKRVKHDDLKKIFIATSNDRYEYKFKKMEKREKRVKYGRSYEKFKYKASVLNKTIKNNLKDGYIHITVLVSQHPVSASGLKPIRIQEVIKKGDYSSPFVTTLVFRTSDCERYDTRYMKNLAEDRKQQTCVEYAEIPSWSDDFKMTEEDIEWMSYTAAKDQYGLTEEKLHEMRFGDRYKKHINKMK